MKALLIGMGFLMPLTGVRSLTNGKRILTKLFVLNALTLRFEKGLTYDYL